MNAQRLSVLMMALLLAGQAEFAAVRAAENGPEATAARAAEPSPIRTVRAIAIVAGRTKVFHGKTYHLVAIRYDNFGAVIFATNNTAPVFLTNGEQKEWLPVTKEDVGFDIKPWPALSLCWLQLPQHGDLELIHGVMDMYRLKGKTPEAVRQEMLKRYEPLVIAVEKIPIVSAKTWDELAVAMGISLPVGVSPSKDPVKESPKPIEPTRKPAQADEPRPATREHRIWFAAGLSFLVIVGLGIVLLRWRRRT